MKFFLVYSTLLVCSIAIPIFSSAQVNKEINFYIDELEQSIQVLSDWTLPLEMNVSHLLEDTRSRQKDEWMFAFIQLQNFDIEAWTTHARGLQAVPDRLPQLERETIRQLWAEYLIQIKSIDRLHHRILTTKELSGQQSSLSLLCKELKVQLSSCHKKRKDLQEVLMSLREDLRRHQDRKIDKKTLWQMSHESNLAKEITKELAQVQRMTIWNIDTELTNLRSQSQSSFDLIQDQKKACFLDPQFAFYQIILEKFIPKAERIIERYRDEPDLDAQEELSEPIKQLERIHDEALEKLAMSKHAAQRVKLSDSLEAGGQD